MTSSMNNSFYFFLPILFANKQSSILTQEHSWSRLNISETAFQALLTEFYVFLPFLDCVCAFGFKKHEDDHNWIGCRMHRGGRWSHDKTEFTYGKIATAND